MIAVVALAVLWPGSTFAQSSLPSREALDPARSAAPPKPSRDLIGQIEAAPCALRASPLTVRITQVAFQGAGTADLTLSGDALAPAYADLLNRDVPVGAVCDIRDHAARIYLDHGMLASVVISDQTLTDGRLVLTVVEARISSVTYHGDIGPAHRQAALYLDRLQGLTPFNLQVAERFLLLTSDIPGISVQARLEADPDAGPGAIRLDVALARDDLDVQLISQNYGSSTVGPDLTLARLDLNSFGRFGERTTFIAYGTLASREQELLQAIERWNLGSDGLSVELSGAWATTRPGGPVSVLELASQSFAGSARFRYPIIRQSRINLNLSVGVDWIDQTLDIGGGLAILTDDHLRILFARLDGQLAPRGLQARGVSLAGSLEVRKGINAFGASRAWDFTTSRFDATADALVTRVEAQADTRLFGPFSGKLSMAWQTTSDSLLAYEEYSVGNLGIGRGYEPSIASGDRALAASLEVSTDPLIIADGRASVRLFSFYDIAELTNLGAGADQLTLSSAGAGLRGQVGAAHLDLTWAKPLDSPFQGFGAPAGRVLIQFVVGR